MSDSIRLELRDSNSPDLILGEVTRTIQQRRNRTARFIEYKGTKYPLLGGIRTNYFIYIDKEKL